MLLQMTRNASTRRPTPPTKPNLWYKRPNRFSAIRWSRVIFVRRRLEQLPLLGQQLFLCQPALLHFRRPFLTCLRNNQQSFSPLGSRIPTRSCSLCSPATAKTSCTYSGKPSSLSALSMCSAAMVFFASFSAISFASEDMRVTNSTLQSIKRSRASLPKVRPDLSPRISVMTFWIVAK